MRVGRGCFGICELLCSACHANRPNASTSWIGEWGKARYPRISTLVLKEWDALNGSDKLDILENSGGGKEEEDKSDVCYIQNKIKASDQTVTDIRSTIFKRALVITTRLHIHSKD